MNTLSWLIYFAGVVHSFNFVATVLFIGLPIITLMKMSGVFVTNQYALRKEDQIDQMPFTAKQMIFVWLLVCAIGVVVPSRQTVILIASSEYGEKILKNPKINEIIDPSIDLLKTWIEKEKKELVEDKPNKEK